MMKVLSLFSGIGAFEAALDNIGIDFELVGYCEIDKYASKSYSAIHGVPESMNYGDITKIDEKKLPKDIDLITYGFPCQDISLAGKQKGLFNEDGTQTRSGLFFEALRIIEETKPKIAIAENVKNLVGKKFKEQFEIVLKSLEEAGYNNYWKVLNSKDYGIPQNRERVFIVSIRKDIDTGIFEFPKPYELKLRLKDLLEDEVDEKFYLSDKMFNYAFNIFKEAKGIGFSDGVDNSYINPDVAQTIGCRSAAHQRSGTTNYVSNNIDKQLKVSDMKKILVKTNNSKGYDVAEVGDYINVERPSSTTRRGMVGHGVSQTLDTKENHCVVTEPFIVRSVGRNPENPSDRTTGSPTEQRLESNSQGICNTLTTVHKDNYVCEPSFVNGDICKTIKTGGHGSVDRHSFDMVEHNLRIRKLTPKECFRLMGFCDEDFEKAASVCSNTQLYKQAGNSIVVDVLEELFCMMFDEDGNFYT